MHRWDPLIWVLLPVELFDLCRLDESHVTAAAALLALAALPSMLADAAAAAVLAQGAPPPVLADAAAAAVLALGALPPVLAKAAAAAVLARGALSPVLADAAAAALLAPAALPPVFTDAATAALFALAALPPVLADAAAAAVLTPAALPPVLALLLYHAHAFTRSDGATRLYRGPRRVAANTAPGRQQRNATRTHGTQAERSERPKPGRLSRTDALLPV